MRFFSRFADHREPNSIASRLRLRRLEFFTNLLATVSGPVTILDVGGNASFWKAIDCPNERVKIILLNVTHEPVQDPRFTYITGDARDLSQFPEQSIDIVYSNSVIEHVGSFEQQRRMADE